jgi:phytoene dehydrogenase-like protein
VDERVDVAVVGGGLAGLAAAATAARAGVSVMVFDGHGFGGRASTDEREGFRLNRGGHALYVGGAGKPVLDALGVAVHGGPPATGGAMIHLRGSLHRLPSGASSLLRTSALGVKAKASFGKLFGSLGRLKLASLADTTQRQWLDSLDLHPDARRVVETLSRLVSYAHAPDVVSADVAVHQLQLSGGVLYLDGGWQSLVDGLRSVATVGGAVTCDESVQQIEVAERDAVVAAGSGRVRARRVVLAAGTPSGCGQLLDEMPSAWSGLGPEITAASLDLGLRAAPRIPIVLDADEPQYFSVHAPPAQLAPSGSAVAHAMRYLLPGEQHDHATVRSGLEAHARRSGVVDDDIVTARYLHRMVVAGALPTPATGGLAGRPTVTSSGHGSVLVAGDWVGPDGFLADAALASGAAAGRRAARDVR